MGLVYGAPKAEKPKPDSEIPYFFKRQPVLEPDDTPKKADEFIRSGA